ncbi:MAG: glycosyltransferase N-terminal domain-containing protein [Verrucomicrobiales bacterium]|nr:glycosyltransferase N-terminal domain-containing protein [Verrucomicrobiales bacterium]
MPRPLVYLIYNLLLPVVLVIGFPSFIIKGIRRGGLARNFRQRFGIFSPELGMRLKEDRPIWIHAVSVGEIFIALKIIEAIHARSPDQLIVLSTTTTTGYAVADEKAEDKLIVIHNPVDLPWIAGKVARLVNPLALVLVEAEIWPNLVATMKRRSTPVLLANARLSPRSARRYKKFGAFIEPIFSQLDAVSIPFEADREKWGNIGVDPEKIHLLGSVKFDSMSAAGALEETLSELRAWLAQTGFPESGRILLAGSTHDGEERLIANLARKIRVSVPYLAVVIVPRHAERGASISARLKEDGFDPVLRVEAKDATSNPVESLTEQGSVSLDERVWIANTTGELRAWFHLSEVVIIGKSFSGEGGQNPVEPILAGKPVIVGPHMQNFADVVTDLLLVEGLCQAGDAADLPDMVRDFLLHPETGEAMAQRGAEAMARHEGAAERTAAFVIDHLATID